MKPEDLDVALEDATDVMPFSNSTAGELFMANWCAHCAWDQGVVEGEGCPLVLLALLGKTPMQWKREPGSQSYSCSAYKESGE
jgi:hypothetical protein